MVFIPLNYETILNNMVNHVRANTTITDFTIGSVARTLLEAAALEDDEQYFQMVQLLDAFRIATATGTDLDERAVDYNVYRLIPTAAVGEVTISDTSLVTSTLKFDVSSGAGATLFLNDSSAFPAAPFTIRVGEGTPQVEDCSVTNHNTSLGILTVASLVNDHDAGERVSKTGAGDKTINSGVSVQVPAKSDSAAITYSTLVKTTIADGNYSSAPILTKATTIGAIGNVAAGQISQFQGSPPFAGAVVTNTKNMSGGRDLETDDQLRSRLIGRLQQLSRGTVPAIESAAIGVTDPVTGQSIVTAKLKENFPDPYNHILYVDDGSGFTPTKTIMARTSFVSSVGTTLTVNSVSSFPDSGYVLVDPGDPANAEYRKYIAINGATNIITLDPSPGALSNPHVVGDEVIFVEVVGIAEDGQNFFWLQNYPILNNSFELYDNNVGSFILRPDSQYFVNRTNGEIQYLGGGLLTGTVVLAHYSYYTGLLAQVQKVITGDPHDRINYPGVAAGGIIINISTPTIRRISVTISITVKNGFDEIQLRDQVKLAIEAYIRELLIGDNVYRAVIIERAVRVNGVENAILSNPVSDITILEDELPVPYDIYGDSLVKVL